MATKSTKNKVTLETIAQSIVDLGQKFSNKLTSSISKLDIKLSSEVDGLDKNLSKKNEDKIDELALAIARGFASVDKKFEDLETRLGTKIDGVDERLSKRIGDLDKNLSAQIIGLDDKIKDLNFHKVRDEVSVLDKRVSRIEVKIGTKI